MMKLSPTWNVLKIVARQNTFAIAIDTGTFTIVYQYLTYHTCMWISYFSDFFSWFDEKSCKWKSVENTICSQDEVTTTTNPTTTTAAAAEQRSVIQSSTTTEITELPRTTSSTITSAIATSTTTKSTTRKLFTTTLSTALPSTVMTTITQALTPTDSRLLFIEPEIYQLIPTRHDFLFWKMFRLVRTIFLDRVPKFHYKKSLQVVKIFQLIGIAHLVHYIILFACDNVQQGIK